ncbi:MAG: CaiB/BaiF CoA-transferase family protein [Pseudomonadota bacterium]|nr:CoA transferase [Pseudomonadota bacterium]MBU1398153.1 CoA transferase [Pseudomonadota bacterium]MBU1569359.1 CoA transferase [Pseudomonadota bacterium]
MIIKGALSGIKVLDMSRLLPGPYCSMILGDHGARIIAVEDRRFLADGLFFDPVNRNKEHMSLNLKTQEGKEIFFRLIKDADVFMEGFRPGVVNKLGIDYESVRKINSGIIYCSITGYGQTGPYRDRVGHDANYLSFSGVLDLIGEPDKAPAIPGVQIADIAGGGMNAAIGILLALYAREKTGAGQYIDISMTDGMVALMPVPLFYQEISGQIARRGDFFLSHRYACYSTYETADGRYLSIGAVENRFWKRLCEIMEVPEYAALQYDETKRAELIDFMRTAFKKKTLDEWSVILSSEDVCWGRVQNLPEVLEDPLFAEREMVIEISGKDGKKRKILGIPVKLSGTPGSVRTPPPGFGENTGDILRELGYNDEKIREFGEKGII